MGFLFQNLLNFLIVFFSLAYHWTYIKEQRLMFFFIPPAGSTSAELQYDVFEPRVTALATD